jgi:plasmid stability protein
MQYTIRNVPDTLDEALRRAAREQGKSLNEVAIEALARGAGVTGECGRQRDLGDIAGTWRKDPAFDDSRTAQDTIDEGMWR